MEIYYIWRHDESDSIGIVNKNEVYKFEDNHDIVVDYTDMSKEDAIIKIKAEARLYNLDICI